MTELNLVCYIINITVILMCGGIFMMLPKITRKSFLFGVKIPEEGQLHEEAVRLRKSFIAHICVGMLITLALATAQFFLLEELSVLAVMYLPLVLVGVQFAAYIKCWKGAKALKKSENWTLPQITAADTRSAVANSKMQSIPWFYYIFCLAATIACIVFGFVMYPKLPDKIPIHFDANMVADAWSDKSVMTVLAIPLFMFGLLVTMVITAVIFAKAKLQINQQNPALSFAQNKAYRRGMQHCLGLTTLSIVAIFAVPFTAMIAPDVKVPTALFWGFIVFSATPVVAYVIYAGQGGCKLKPKYNEEDNPVLDDSLPVINGRNDDEHWYIGMFYYNKNDPALMVEDRFGANIGFNYANIAARIAVGVVTAGVIVLYVWATMVFV
ncbi:MAG: DUF1648 domain-containing protein [Oscillospiraceae bacterium]|nr:DUF1648 domain-containing protein [Oscillospiraceae bacterium]